MMSSKQISVEDKKMNTAQTKHTPGPWHLEQGTASKPGEFTFVADLGKLPNGVGTMRTIGKTFDYCRESEATANARLISAAPDMMRALTDIFLAMLCPEPRTLKGWEQRHNRIDEIVRKALNKAEGSTL